MSLPPKQHFTNTKIIMVLLATYTRENISTMGVNRCGQKRKCNHSRIWRRKYGYSQKLLCKFKWTDDTTKIFFLLNKSTKIIFSCNYMNNQRRSRIPIVIKFPWLIQLELKKKLWLCLSVIKLLSKDFCLFVKYAQNSWVLC